MASSPYWWDKYDRLWDFLSISCLVASLCFLLDISTHLLHGEADIVGSIIVIIQTSLTPFIIGGLLTQPGKNTIDLILKRMNIPVHFQQEGRLIVSTVFLIILIIFHSCMPIIANIYYHIGSESEHKSEFNKSIKNYKRALKFAPDNSEIRYGLAKLLERFDDLELAQREYKISAAGGSLDSINKLSRLYLLKEKPSQTDQATSILLPWYTKNNGTIKWNKIPKDTKYDLLKNIGWARLQQKRYEYAYNFLNEAIKINTCKASAHCLLAITKEKTGHEQDALVEWEKCAAFAESVIPEEDKWYGIAQQRGYINNPIQRNTNDIKWEEKCELNKN